MSSIKARRISSQERAVSFGRASAKGSCHRIALLFSFSWQTVQSSFLSYKLDLDHPKNRSCSEHFHGLTDILDCSLPISSGLRLFQQFGVCLPHCKDCSVPAHW